MPVRVLLTGLEQTPAVDALIAVFPRETVLRRLAVAREATLSQAGLL
jgi:glutamyl-tRNA synthetase